MWTGDVPRVGRAAVAYLKRRWVDGANIAMLGFLDNFAD
jgi:hypothetical protein